MPTEADTCRTLVTPKLQAAGWDTDPHSITEQRTFTDGRIIVHGSGAKRRPGKRADYILRYTRDFPVAVAKSPKHQVKRWKSGGPCPKCGKPLVKGGSVCLWD